MDQSDPDRQAMEVLLARLVYHRRLQRISQKEMALRLGVSQQRVSQMERGYEVRLSLLQRYVRVLGARLHVEAVPLEGD